MPDRVYIKYNGVDAFYPQATPFISLDEQGIYVGELWGRAESMTLQGQLTGCTYNALVQAQTDLLNRFNTPFQTLEVYQQTGDVSLKAFQKDLVEITSIQFDESRWVGVLPYSVSMTCYPSGLFSGAYGILNPSDTWSFTEQQNASLEISHSISCQPFNTSNGPSNALDNARNWAFGRTGTTSLISPILISGVSPANFCLLTQQETIDRFNGTYSLIENYTNDLARTGYGVIRYTTDITSGNNGITVSLNGTAQGCGRNITGLRYALSNLDKTAIAANAYRGVFNRTDLNPIPLAQTFNEDPYTTKIDFSCQFDNSNLPPEWFDYTVSCSMATNGVISASIQGTVFARGGGTLSKLGRAKAYASGINLYNLVAPFYSSFDSATAYAPLNPVAAQSSQTNNETAGTVDLSASFDNSVITSQILDRFDATINITPAIAQVDSQPILDGLGQYSVVSLNYAKRAVVSINGNAIVNHSAAASAGDAAVRQKAYQLFQQYGSMYKATLDQNVVTFSRTDNRVISFSFVWSCGPSNVVGPSSVGGLSP